PGIIPLITVNNKNSTSFLEVNWTDPPGVFDSYIVSLSGSMNRTISAQPISKQVNVTGLLPGREFSITIQTNSGTCSQISGPVSEATYPTPPGDINITNTGTNSVSLSWGDPRDMSNATKTFNVTYSNSTSVSPWTQSSSTLDVTLHGLQSGTQYTITVITIGARNYPSSPVTTTKYTKPFPVGTITLLTKTSTSVNLTWSKPSEYKIYYTYRVLVNTTPPTEIITPSESASIDNLTSGQTFTFTVITRADSITESDHMSFTDCTYPGIIPLITVNNKNSTSFLEVNWTDPPGVFDSYIVSLSGSMNRTISAQPISKQVNVTGLLPGREFSITIQTN
ncbi:hypothetical protein GDO86_019384, partial [Hymenochirus boettgeri]